MALLENLPIKNKLLALYKNLLPTVRTVYVYPHIKRTAQYNPYIELLYEGLTSEYHTKPIVKSASPHKPYFLLDMFRFSKKALIHYHWLDVSDLRGVLVLLFKMVPILLFRITGGTIIWTIHNKQPHAGKYPRLNNFLYSFMAQFIAKKLHVHSSYGKKFMSEALSVKENKFVIIPHPLYPVTIHKQEISKVFIQSKLKIQLQCDKKTVLLYGFIAPYKGILELIPTFIAQRNLNFVIVGEVKKGEELYFKQIKNSIEPHQNIYLHSERVDSQTEAYLFGAVDYVLFNLQNILTSGSVILARSYNKSIILPDLPCFEEFSGNQTYLFNSVNNLLSLLKGLQ